MMPDDHNLDDLVDAALAPEAPELLKWLDNPADPDPAPDWTIDGVRTAEWCARRLRRADAVIAEASAEAARLRAVADGYEERVRLRMERDRTYFLGRLRAWHDEILADNPRAKTVDLPTGRLERRAGGVRVEVLDAEVAREWLEEHADECLDYPDPQIKKAAVKSRFSLKVATEPGAYPAVDADSGEVVPGVSIVRAPATSTFRFTTPDSPDEEETP